MPAFFVLVIVCSCLTLCSGYVSIGLLIPSTSSVPGLPSNATVFGAFSQALANVSSTLEFKVSKNTNCEEGTALNEAFGIKDIVDSFIGPVCEKGEIIYLSLYRQFVVEVKWIIYTCNLNLYSCKKCLITK